LGLIDSVESSVGPNGGAIKAAQRISKGTSVFKINGSLVNTPDKYTIQIGEQAHILPDGQLWAFLNHSCDPNSRIDFKNWSLVTTRTILKNEELTFNYLTTEWELAAPFLCGCGAEACLGLIKGLKHLSESQQESLEPHCSPYLAARLRQLETQKMPGYAISEPRTNP